MNNPVPLSPAVLRQAAEWMVCLDDQPDHARQHAYNAWLAADLAHQEAVRQLQGSVSPLRTLPRGPTAAALNSVTGSSARPVLKALGVALLLLLPAGLALQRGPLNHVLADIHTSTGQWHTQVLPDGSRITLDGRSAVDLQFNAQSRTVQLLGGEILVEVTKDPHRPFRVVTPQGNIRALGTRFTVALQGDTTRLAMIESSTQVTSRESVRDVHANQQVSINASGIHALADVDGAGIEQAWAQHQLQVKELPLSQVLAQLARFHSGYLLYDEDTLAQLSVTAVLPADDSPRALRLLARSLPIEVQQFTPWVTRITLKKP